MTLIHIIYGFLTACCQQGKTSHDWKPTHPGHITLQAATWVAYFWEVMSSKRFIVIYTWLSIQLFELNLWSNLLVFDWLKSFFLIVDEFLEWSRRGVSPLYWMWTQKVNLSSVLTFMHWSKYSRNKSCLLQSLISLGKLNTTWTSSTVIILLK